MTQERRVAVMFGSKNKLTRLAHHASEARPGEQIDFVLVGSTRDYHEALKLGFQPILVQQRFSVTDRRASVPRAAGPLFRAWRWRRIMLNEGISALVLRRERSVGVLMLAGVLAGVHLRFYRAGQG